MDPYAWSLDPDAVVLVPAMLLAYLWALRRWPAPRWRIASFLAGLGLVFAAFVSPLDTLALHYLLSAHLLQNVVVAEWAPALCVLGLPPALAAALARLPGVRALTRPFVALPLWLATYFAWHSPWAYDAALRHPSWLLHLEHGCYFTTGALFWWTIVHGRPWRLRSGGKAVYLFAAFVLASPLGLLLALLPRAIYHTYESAPRLRGLSALSDQQIAGATMAIEQAVVFFAVFALYVARFVREEQAADAVRSPAT